MPDKKRTQLLSKAQSLPDKPGIYFFQDQEGKVIYIGKARSLKDRARSYFSLSADPKVNTLLAEAKDIDFILTGSEKEAAFLENNFIQHYQPKFNLRLKDDKSFPYLKLTLQEKFPHITLTRRVEADGARYFGPFSPSHQARQTIHLITRSFGIRSCEEQIPGKRNRPCLDYDLQLCTAPCVQVISEAEYRSRVDHALLFLEGKVEILLKALELKMNEAAEKQDYEQAARWRDLIFALEQVKDKPKVISVKPENKDIFGYIRREERAVLYAFRMRNGKVIESESRLFQVKKDTPDKAALLEHLREFYPGRREIPEKILLPFFPSGPDEIEAELSSLRQGKVKLHVPQKGKDKKLVELAGGNALIVLDQEAEEPQPLKDLKTVLGLESLPRRIEGFDISNTAGTESVGSLVAFEDGKPKKDAYRKYKIVSVKGPNDVASLMEAIQRRYTRILEEKAALPDLVLVDGGKGQLAAATKALSKLGLNELPVISLAKREEILYSSSHRHGLRLERTSAALKLIQQVRDEAHRFALSFHRQRREKKSFASVLDNIPGLGEKKKAKLLSKYRDLEKIREASFDELAKLIGLKIAKSLKKALGKNN